MAVLGRVGRQLSSLLFKAPVGAEVEAELSFHVEMRTRELVARGMDPVAARSAALGRFGDIGAVSAMCESIGNLRERDMRRTEYLSELRQDIRFALRQLIKTPAFAAIAVGTLALGVGATTAIFSAVESVVLRPFAYANQDRVMFVSEYWRQQDGGVSAGNYTDWAAGQKSFDHLAAVAFRSFTVSQGESPERVFGAEVTAPFFATFGVKPALGRAFTEAEDQPGTGQVVVLSHTLWARSFGGSPSAVGREIQLNGKRYMIVGVMPSSFDPLAGGEQLWVPMAMTAERRAMHDEHYLLVAGLLKSGITMEQAQRDMDVIQKRLGELYPKDDKDRGVRVQPLSTLIIGNLRTRLFVILGAVSCVLLIACGNVANLLLARGAGRSKEIAIRTAIGAGRSRIVRQLLTESLVLSLLATAAGVGLAWMGIRVLIRLAPASIPRIGETRIDGTVLVFALGVALLSSVVFGLAPALRAARGDLNIALKEGGRQSMASARDRIRSMLIATQVAVALVLLVGAGLLIRSAIYLQQVDPGFDIRQVLAARVALPPTDYRQGALESQQAFERIVNEIKGRPGVVSVAATSQAPMGPGGGSNGLLAEGKAVDPKNFVDARLRMITPDYLSTMRIPLLRGRAFTAQDIAGTPRVAIVSAALAKTMWPNDNPIGKRFGCCEGGPDDRRLKAVIGVAGDVRSNGPTANIRSEFYLPIAQVPAEAWNWIQRAMTIVVRTSAPDPATFTPTLRSAVRDVNPALPIYGITTMEESLRGSTADARFNTTLLTALGLVGMLLAAAGIYSVIAYFVSLRGHEIGIRMALGATTRDVVGLMTWQGLRPILGGIVIGGIAAYWATRLISGSLYGVTASDPVTFGAVALALLAVGVLAAVVPARRAAGVDPTRALQG